MNEHRRPFAVFSCVFHVVSLVCLSALSGCFEPSTPKATPVVPLTDENACARLCTRMETCGGAPTHCEASCERDRARMRDGFDASFVGCVEHELGPTVCPGGGATLDEHKRRGAVSLCYGATLVTYAKKDDGLALRSVLRAVCRRSVRCEPSGDDEPTCLAELSAHTKGSAVATVLAGARPEIVQQIAACVEKRPCEEANPFAACDTPGAPLVP